MDGQSPGSQDAEERAPERSAPERNAARGACIRSTQLLERAATELVTGTEASVRAPLRPSSYQLTAAPTRESSGLAGGCLPRHLVHSLAAPPLAVRVGGGARIDASAVSSPGLLLWKRLRGSLSCTVIPGRWPGILLTQLRVSTSTSRYLRIRASCLGVHSSQVCGTVAATSSCSARLLPASKSR